MKLLGQRWSYRPLAVALVILGGLLLSAGAQAQQTECDETAHNGQTEPPLENIDVDHDGDIDSVCHGTQAQGDSGICTTFPLSGLEGQVDCWGLFGSTVQVCRPQFNCAGNETLTPGGSSPTPWCFDARSGWKAEGTKMRGFIECDGEVKSCSVAVEV